jgi:hypothetical protein
LTESSSANRHAAEKRRSTRVMQAVPITVKGTDALGQSFKEYTSTVMVNCYGCKFQSKHYIPKNTVITLEIRNTKHNRMPRIARGHVIWVQRPRTFREVFHIGMEFDIPGDVWGIEVPPKDWFPHPEDEELVIPVYPHAGEPEPVTAPASTRHAEKSEATAETQSIARTVLTSVAESPAHSASAKPHATPAAAHKHDSQHEISPQLLKAAAQEAVAEEMARLRSHLDGQLQQTIEGAVNVLIERVTEAAAEKIAAQVAERTASALESARPACPASDGQLDSKIRQAVEEALAAQDDNPYRTPARRKRRPRF